MKGIKMKKIIQYSTILGTALMLSAPVALADTGGYVRIKGFESHFHALGFGNETCQRKTNINTGSDCKFANTYSDKLSSGATKGE